MFTREKQEMKRVPMMPVRDMVIFPQQMTPFIVGREASVRALEEALAATRRSFFRPSMTLLSMTRSRGDLRRRHPREHRPKRQAAGWQYQSAR